MEVKVIKNSPVKLWVDELDEKAISQITNLASLPFVFHHIAMMPDAHAGMGMPIGGVLACKNVVIPNAVGVDIGCGMCAVKTNIRSDSLTPDIIRKQIMSGIRAQIPLGMKRHKTQQDESYLPQGFDIDKLFVVRSQWKSIKKQVGTLGGGNHFIELQKDEEGWLWIMIHSGSRNLGKMVGEHYNKLAKQLNAQYHSSGNSSHNDFK